MIGGISQSSGNGVFDLLRAAQKGQEEGLEAGASASLTAQLAAAEEQASSGQASSNLMARNFASAGREESKYLKARQAGQEAASKQAGRQTAILNAALAELGALSEKDSGNYAIRNLIGRKAARRMHEEGQQSVQEESERNLKEIKENIEQKAQEATAPKDENGKPIESGETGNAGSAAPLPEISGSGTATAPAPEASSQAPAVSAAAPELATAAPAPATPSINITV